MASNKVSADEMRWRAEDDARTLKRAMEVKNDPKRMSAVRQHMVKEMKAMNSVMGMGKKRK